jgi:cell pole-organizing protein PopZ
MTQPAKGHEPSMEEILASIRRIIADEPSNNLRDEASRNEASRSESSRSEASRNEASRERSWRNDSPRIEALRREAAGENPSSESLPHASRMRTIALSEETQPPRTDVLAQPPAPNAAPAWSAVSEVTPEPRPPVPSLRSGLSSTPHPATAQEEIDEIIAQLHAGTRAAPPVTAEVAEDIFELTERMAVPEALPAAEFATSDDLARLDDEEEQEEGEAQEEEEAHEEQELETAADAAEPTEEPRRITVAQAAAGEPHRPIYDQAHDLVRDPDRDRSHRVAEQGLISAATSAVVDSAFSTLAQTVLVQNGRTLEDLVREMLRPMLKTWLDDNLPSLVERLVRAEIERVSRGRG